MRKQLALKRMRRRTEPRAAELDAPVPTAEATAIARVNELTRAARAGWISLLFVLIFIAVTIAGVEDIDFFLPERQTALPLIGVSIPTAMFFVLSPPLIAALYGNLHFHMLKLWGALSPARLPATIAGVPASDHLVASFIIDLGLHFRRDGALRKRDLRLLTSVLTFILVFALGPIVLGWLWLRSMYSLDEWLTMWGGLSFAFVLHVMLCSSLVTIWTRCSCRRRRQKLCRWITKPSLPRRRSVGTRLGTLVLLVTVVGWFRTEGTLDAFPVWLVGERPTALDLPNDFDWVAWLRDNGGAGSLAIRDAAIALTDQAPWWRATPFPGFLASPRLSGAILADLPEGWVDRETSRSAHRENWCNRNQIPLLICPNFPEFVDSDRIDGAFNVELYFPRESELGITLTSAHQRHCSDFQLEPWDEIDCFSRFLVYGVQMAVDFFHQRNLALSTIPQRDLANRDLRGAVLDNANLTQADLTGARLNGVNLRNGILESISAQGVQMPRANLIGTQVQVADLQGAMLAGANLAGADMEWAVLGEGLAGPGAQMQGAQMFGIRLRFARLAETQLQGAVLIEAEMGEAVFSSAQMQGAILEEAELSGAWLRGVDLRGAYLGGATMSADTDLRYADLRFAAVRSLDRETSQRLQPFFSNIFADGTVDLGLEPRPNHWSEDNLEMSLRRFRPPSAFYRAWNDWIATAPPLYATESGF